MMSFNKKVVDSQVDVGIRCERLAIVPIFMPT